MPRFAAGCPGCAWPPSACPAAPATGRIRSYDSANGRLDSQTYPSGLQIKYNYDTRGFLSSLSNLTAGIARATNVLNYSYLWDSLGHLLARSDANGDGSTGAVTDIYAYDNLGRLTNYTVHAPALNNYSRSVDLQYNALGMLQSKTDVGAYSYPAQGTGVVRPHALQSVAGTNYGYDANGNLTSASAIRTDDKFPFE